MRGADGWCGNMRDVLRPRRVLGGRPRGLVNGLPGDLLRRARAPVLRLLGRAPLPALAVCLRRLRRLVLAVVLRRPLRLMMGLLRRFVLLGPGGVRTACAMLLMHRGACVVLVPGDVLLGRSIIVTP